MYKEIVIDFETMDWGIRDGMGPGWPWHGVSVLGMSVQPLDRPMVARYVTDQKEIIEILEAANTIIAHNAQYEAGIIHMLGVDIKEKTILCTKLASLFVKSNRFDNTLNGLAKTELGETKLKNELVEACIERGLVVPLKSYYAENTETTTYKNARRRAANEVWDHLDQLQYVDPVVEKYANIDVKLTLQLFKAFKKTMVKKKTWDAYVRFNQLIQVTTLMRAKGIRVDLKRSYEVKGILRARLVAVEAKLWELSGMFNYASDKQTKAWAEELGYPPEPDLTGRLGFGKSWIKKHRHDERVKWFGQCKRFTKAIEFCDSLAKFEKNGRVYPELVILGARTGRFSCRNPNAQQIPSRDKLIGPLIRSLYLPEEREKWFSLDYSGQEDRLRVHFAAKAKDESALELVQKFKEDPGFDTHQDTCDKMNHQLGEDVLDRSMAKTQNHGLSYGMGIAKQARALGVTETQARKLKELFFQVNPYVKGLFDGTKKTIERRGYLRTVNGRHVHVDEGFEYKALSALIQGSACDQTAEALIQCYEAGIIPLAAIHDEICLSGDENTAAIVKEIMENAVKLEIPTVTDIGSGSSWAEAK
jgi:DNA polymerase I-like protein with 3'-5' exonuclease and polymerase domains